MSWSETMSAFFSCKYTDRDMLVRERWKECVCVCVCRCSIGSALKDERAMKVRPAGQRLTMDTLFSSSSAQIVHGRWVGKCLLVVRGTRALGRKLHSFAWAWCKCWRTFSQRDIAETTTTWWKRVMWPDARGEMGACWSSDLWKKSTCQ